MPDLWMPGATHLDVGDHAPTDGGPAKVISHVTWDRNATAAKPAPLVPYENLADYFGRNAAGKAAAPHVLWDPFTGRLTQFVPANSRSKSLVDTAGGTRTNRAGSVVIQVEALFFPYCQVGGKTYARLVDTPCLGWDRLHAWVRSWGVPDVWPMGRPVDFASHRNEAVWESTAGWYGHSQVPENDHQDPGSWPAFPAIVTEDDMSAAAEQQIDALEANLLHIGSKTETDAKGKPVPHGAGYYLANVEQDTAALNLKVDRIEKAVAALTALVKSKP